MFCEKITDSRSKEPCVPEDGILTITYGGELQAGKAVRQCTIDVKDVNHSSPLFELHKDANYCIVHYVWNSGQESHRVTFSLKEEFERMTDITDKHDTNQETKFKLRQVQLNERKIFLQDLPLKGFQFLVSKVYKSEEETEKEVAISVELPEKMRSDGTIYTFSYFILREGKIVDLSVSFDPDSRTINGPVLPKDVFCAVAELTAEKKTLGKNGGSFISETDNRIQVQVPVGALDSATVFTFKVENVDLDRYRQYGDLFPDIVETLVGLPICLNIDTDMKKPLNEKVKIYLPVIRDGNDEEVLFVHWEDEKATPLCHKEDHSSPDSPYYVEVDHFSSVSAQIKRSNATVEETIRATKLVRGQTSKCIILTFIVLNHMRGMPSLLIDCVEMYKVDAAVKIFKEKGYLEVPGSQSKDCELDEGGYVNVEIMGNLQLEVGTQKKDMRIRFSRKASSNRLLVPVKFRNPNQPLSIIAYTANKKEWVFKVYFSMADFLDRAARPTTSLSLQEQSLATVPKVLSEKSLSALGEYLSSSTFKRLGLELDISNDRIDNILEARRDTTDFGFRLLKHWIQTNARQPYDKLVDNLIDALEEIHRGDVAEMVRKCNEKGKRIRRAESGEGGNQSVSQSNVPSHSKPCQSFPPFK